MTAYESPHPVGKPGNQRLEEGMMRKRAILQEQSNRMMERSRKPPTPSSLTKKTPTKMASFSPRRLPSEGIGSRTTGNRLKRDQAV